MLLSFMIVFHFITISWYISASVLFVMNEDKPVALVYSSFTRVATSGLRNISETTSSSS